MPDLAAFLAVLIGVLLALIADSYFGISNMLNKTAAPAAA